MNKTLLKVEKLIFDSLFARENTEKTQFKSKKNALHYQRAFPFIDD